MSRRRLLQAGATAALATGAAAAGAGVAAHVTGADDPSAPRLEPFHGLHQAGIATPQQTHGVFAAYILSPTTNLEAARRMMRLVTDDAARLTQGAPVLGDQEPELAVTEARLTVTFGFGPDLFTKLDLTQQRPAGLRDLPDYPIDRLQPAMSGGDVLVQICAGDPMVVAHALRQLTKTFGSFARPRWVQRGFTQPSSHLGGSGAPRNLMGQVDGSVNPTSGSTDFNTVVWSPGPPDWFANGTMLVVRRIAMTLNTWDELDTAGKELAVGRRLRNGAPLTGRVEGDPPDLAAVDAAGLPVIPPFAHIARAAPRAPSERFLRRPYNYDDGLLNPATDSGLIFAAYQADITTQYLPVQQRLAEQDLMNTWTTPIGSAVFALPPGCQPGGYIGETLLA